MKIYWDMIRDRHVPEETEWTPLLTDAQRAFYNDTRPIGIIRLLRGGRSQVEVPINNLIFKDLNEPLNKLFAYPKELM